ncbi:TOMM20-like protein 1 [Varanus komodoensis]|uniref:TOMM20-like protein 1 n=1 Tax=Varanus komodoensis TaxID=61221 RepID=UPI001CF7D580|nr:TOMM20-like protein 1 [Varanus komodoensis]
MERGARRALPWLLAAACGLAVLGFCLYFDAKRRSAPDFPRRLREKRRKEREKAKEREAELRELKDTAKVQEFFLQEIQLGELWLARGEHKKSIGHLANAVAVCTHPNQLMQVFEQTLPPQVFEMLVRSIPYAMQRLETALNEQDARDE